MSLTSQLRDGGLAEWCAETFPGTAVVAQHITDATVGRHPVRPKGHVSGRHWAEIGGAFGIRLAALVQPAPPYYALLGMVNSGMVSRQWADQEASKWPTHQHLLPEQRGRALELRPTLSGWLDLGTPPVTAVDHTEAEPVLSDLLERTRRYLSTHAPTGQLGTPAVEGVLARIWWLLSECEDVYRAATISPALHALFSHATPTVDQLRSAADPTIATELVELSHTLDTSGSLTQFHQLAGNPPPGQPLGIACPVFVPHWADGDLLLGNGDFSTLLDVKTVIHTNNIDRTSRWLWQLLAYTWLDYDDHYRIRNVGLYLARHGTLITWPIDDLAEQLLDGKENTETARHNFRAAARTALTAEGARIPHQK